MREDINMYSFPSMLSQVLCRENRQSIVTVYPLQQSISLLTTKGFPNFYATMQIYFIPPNSICKILKCNMMTV